MPWSIPGKTCSSESGTGEFLRTQGYTNGKVGIYGYSYGGIASIDTPLLIMHGELDVRAPYRQFEIAVAELERHGKVFESRNYPGETHGLSAAAGVRKRFS